MTELKLTKRDAQKESASSLRSQGNVPAVCYGGGFENTTVYVNDIDFRKAYRKVGTSGLITTSGDVNGEQCLVQDMQVHVVTGDILHIDFKMVAQGETTEVTVPVKVTGEPKAVANNEGAIYIAASEVVIETIPSQIPESITIDISKMEMGDTIRVSDLNLDEGVVAIDDKNMLIVSLSGVKENEEEEESNEPVSMEPELVGQKGKKEEAES